MHNDAAWQMTRWPCLAKGGVNKSDGDGDDWHGSRMELRWQPEVYRVHPFAVHPFGGSSRPLVDDGWAERSRAAGQKHVLGEAAVFVIARANIW